MPIEPQHAVTVSIRAPMPQKKTGDEYRAKIVAKFGRVPSWAELAKHEGPGRQWRVTNPTGEGYKRGPVLNRDGWDRKRNAATTKIMQILQQPRPIVEVVAAVDYGRNWVERFLRAAKNRGEVTMTRIGRTVVWECVKTGGAE